MPSRKFQPSIVSLLDAMPPVILQPANVSILPRRYNCNFGCFEGQYEWDLAKAEANLSKHRIGFETATRVFDDPNFLLIEARTNETGAQRRHAIGTAEDIALLLVVHVCRVRTNMPDKSSGLSQREGLTRVSAASMRSSPLSNDQKAVLAGMATKQSACADSDIDYSDIPPLTDSQLARAIRGKFVFGGSRFRVFLDPAVLDTLTEIAARKRIVVNDLVNEVLKRELATAKHPSCSCARPRLMKPGARIVAWY